MVNKYFYGVLENTKNHHKNYQTTHKNYGFATSLTLKIDSECPELHISLFKSDIGHKIDMLIAFI